MKKLYLLKDYEGKSKGERVEVENNVAHGLIEKGVAQLKALERPKRDKMIKKPKRKK